jgi:hypothetical protein
MLGQWPKFFENQLNCCEFRENTTTTTTTTTTTNNNNNNTLQ